MYANTSIVVKFDFSNKISAFCPPGDIFTLGTKYYYTKVPKKMWDHICARNNKKNISYPEVF